MGEKTQLSLAQWPTFDPKLAIDETVLIPIQVNGKKRSEILVPRDIDQDDLREQALTSDAIRKIIGDAVIKKVVIVPQRIVNVVI
jgi:leucyl-tRNA synthetase